MFKRLVLALCLGLLPLPVAAETGAAASVISYPETLDPDCRDGRAKLYDECGDQLALFDEAFARAQAENKILFVNYGAEWCVWCHVFDRTTTKPGAPLEAFTAERFIMVHIDAQHGLNHKGVLAQTKADTIYTGGLPLLFVVAPDGVFAGAVQHKLVVDGGQYDLAKLERTLGELHAAANDPDDIYRKLISQLTPIGGFE